jgi:hypothetical protein
LGSTPCIGQVAPIEHSICLTIQPADSSEVAGIPAAITMFGVAKLLPGADSGVVVSDEIPLYGSRSATRDEYEHWSYWRVLSSDSIMIALAHGLGGLAVRLGTQDSVLTGVGRMVDDVVGPDSDPELGVVATRVRCENESERPNTR